MKSLQPFALEVVREGVTTLEEVERVISFSGERKSEACLSCKQELSAQFSFCPYCGERRGDRPIQMPLRKSGD